MRQRLPKVPRLAKGSYRSKVDNGYLKVQDGKGVPKRPRVLKDTLRPNVSKRYLKVQKVQKIPPEFQHVLYIQSIGALLFGITFHLTILPSSW